MIRAPVASLRVGFKERHATAVPPEPQGGGVGVGITNIKETVYPLAAGVLDPITILTVPGLPRVTMEHNEAE